MSNFFRHNHSNFSEFSNLQIYRFEKFTSWNKSILLMSFSYMVATFQPFFSFFVVNNFSTSMNLNWSFHTSGGAFLAFLSRSKNIFTILIILRVSKNSKHLWWICHITLKIWNFEVKCPIAKVVLQVPRLYFFVLFCKIWSYKDTIILMCVHDKNSK